MQPFQLLKRIKLLFWSLSGGRRRPLGSRRRQLEWMTNFVLLVVSLFGVTAGAGLLGFYKIHLLRFLSLEFFILPIGLSKVPSKIVLGKIRLDPFVTLSQAISVNNPLGFCFSKLQDISLFFCFHRYFQMQWHTKVIVGRE